MGESRSGKVIKSLKLRATLKMGESLRDFMILVTKPKLTKKEFLKYSIFEYSIFEYSPRKAYTRRLKKVLYSKMA